jgi:hypothetical protein
MMSDFLRGAGLGSDFNEFQAGVDFREGEIADSTFYGCHPVARITVPPLPVLFPVSFEFVSGCSSFACIVWLRLLHIFDVSEQCSPMIKPVAVGHIIARTSDGIVVFMNMSLFRPLF